MPLKDRLRPALSALLMLLLAPALLAASLPAQEFDSSASLRPQEEATPAEDPRTEPKKRILKTHAGQALRGLTRWIDGHWELKRQGKWIALPERSVASFRDEKEARVELRKLSRDVGPLEHDKRVALATWMLEQGFEQEALDELDRVLHVEPDHAAAVGLLRTAHLARPQGGDPVVEPKAYARTLFTAALSASPTKRELCVQALGKLLEHEAGAAILREQLRAELVSYSVLRRTTAAHALRRLMPGEELYALMQRCALDTSRPVRESASLALRATDEPGIIIPLVKALGSESRAVRTNAAESLGNVGFNAAVPALVAHFAALPQGSGGGIAPSTANIYIGQQFAYVGDYDVEIAQGASIADPIVTVGDSGVVLDARVGGISGYSIATERRVLNTALRQLTGQNPGSSPADWQRWYAKNQSRFAPPEGATSAD